MEQTTLKRQIHVIPATKQAAASGAPPGARKRVAAYCRVSTESEEQLTSYTAQKTYYTQLISENPNWELVGIYADRGISGTSMKHRTAFNKMIAACKRGRIDIILTKSLSRFARNTVDCLEVVRMLKANGIGVHFEKENIDTLTESSEFLITLFSGFAQSESESISKNVIWGVQKSREAGKVPAKRQFGYRRSDTYKLEIVPEEAELVRHIFQRYLDGCSLYQLQHELEAKDVPSPLGAKKWSATSLLRILSNERYIGDALLQKTYITDCISKTVRKNQGERPMVYVENNHPAIISKEVFYRVQEEMARRSSKRKVMQKSGKTEQGKYSAKYALSEILICGECGTPYKRCTWARNGKKRIVWRCISRLEFGTKYCHNSPTVDEGKLHDAIVKAMNQMAQSQREVRDTVLELSEAALTGQSDGRPGIMELQEQLAAITNEQSELLERVLDDMDDPELNRQLKDITVKKEKLQTQIRETQASQQKQTVQRSRLEELRKFLRECPNEFTEYEDELVRRLIETITVVDTNTILIRFRDMETDIKQYL